MYVANRNGFKAASAASAASIMCMIAPNMPMAERASYERALESGATVQVFTPEGTAFISKVVTNTHTNGLPSFKSLAKDFVTVAIGLIVFTILVLIGGN